MKHIARNVNGLRPLVALLGALLYPAAVHAGLDPAKAITQYRHDVWRVEQGLPQNTVPTIAQTSDGYIWFGTELGLVRFDGLRFTVFDKANTPQLKTNTIYALLADRQGNLWIGTNGGGLTRLRNGVFRTYTTKDGLASDAILSVYEDRAGSLWVGTNGGGVSRFENGRFATYTTKEGLADNAVFAITGEADGTLWFGTHSGLTRLVHGVFSTLGAKDGLRNTYVKALYVDRRGNLWIGTRGGLSHWKDGRFKTFTKKEGLPSEAISSVREDDSGSLWIGTLGGGICRFTAGKFTSYSAEDGLSNDDVWSLYYDRGGNLWIGTGGGGLNRLMNPRFTAYDTKEGLSSDMALAVFQDREGDVWIGTNGGGVNRLHEGRFTTLTAKDGLADNRVFTIAQDRGGAMWFGTRKGLNRYQDGRFRLYTKKNGLGGDIAMASFVDSHDRLWIGTRGGLSVLENGKFTNYTAAQGLSAELIQAIAEDREGSLWIGTGGGGLNRLRDGKIEVFDTRRGLSNDVVMALHHDASGGLWIGTNGGGLNRYKDGKFTAYTTKEGLPDDAVFQILEDAAGNLWMTSNKGIFRCQLADLDRVARGQATSVRSVLYDKADGMKSRECNGGFQPAGWRARDGRLWLPTMQGVVAVDPKNLGPSEAAPPVVIEGARINRLPADPAEVLQAQPGSGELEFRYAAISYLSPEKTTFRYKLEGFDRDWVDAGTRREAYYTNIPPGSYRFLVTAVNGEGTRDTTGRSMTFALRPHWWVSWWFRGFALSVSLLSALSAVWWRSRMSTFHQRRLEALVQQRTAELSEQVHREERARTELAQAQQRLIELSRQSGMAEVATGILHNVGNVLNSVNVSANLLGGTANELRAENLVSVVEILRQHADDLTAFIANDPKGQRMLPYLAKLGGHIQEQRRKLLSEVHLLRERIEHIKAIVATQQRYAKAESLTEQLELSDLVEDAIRIIQPGSDRHNIRLERDFQPVPLVYADKHNVLQILVNLLRNARQAIGDSQSAHRVIRVAIRRHGVDRVRIEVRDTGIGVAVEKLTQIFSQGFTSRPEGHGFGLHASALAAQDMGGSLWAESDGLGTGATFTLEIPVAAAGSRFTALAISEAGGQSHPAAAPALCANAFDQLG